MLTRAHGWTGGVCPICLFAVRAAPLPDHSLAISCDRCGDFALSDAAEDVLDAPACPFDRARLSEAVRDVCLMAECEWPLIDSLTAAALIGMALADAR